MSLIDNEESAWAWFFLCATVVIVTVVIYTARYHAYNSLLFKEGGYCGVRDSSIWVKCEYLKAIEK